MTPPELIGSSRQPLTEAGVEKVLNDLAAMDFEYIV